MFSRRQMMVQSGLLFAPLLDRIDARADGPQQDISEPLDALRKRLGIPGCGAIVVSLDRIIAHGVGGIRKMGEAGLIPKEAHWQIGSITKTFTATLTAILVERRKLTWDTRLEDVYPTHVKQMAPNIASVTIRQLVTHHSGMGGDVVPWKGVPETNQPGLTLSKRRQKAALLAMKERLDFVPGTKYQYSNRAYNLLGAVLETVSGRSWETLILEDIAKPLGIQSVVFGEPALSRPDKEPWPHVFEDEHWKAVPAVSQNMYGYHLCNPAGGISLTLDGMAKYMQMHLDAGMEKSILSPAGFKTLHTELEKGGVPGFAIGARGSILGRELSHNGSNGRNAAFHMLLPERSVGVFLAVNAPIPTDWMIWNTLLATALPGKWPRPSQEPPAPSKGLIEGEALELVSITSGRLDFQNFDNLSQKILLWWAGAKDGKQLVMGFQIPNKGRYDVEGLFTFASDYGAVTIKLGGTQKRIDFRAEKLKWETVSLGEMMLDAGVHQITFTAHGNSDEKGIVCHLGLDVLKFRKLD